ncbi:MAG: hypothetical protein J6A37_00485 [Oscillospiraceae bacterium]|nr:hypothetical protein [Oscillospiraceae bacterium]
MIFDEYKNAVNKINISEKKLSEIAEYAKKPHKKSIKLIRYGRSFPIIAAAVLLLAGFTVYAAGNGILDIIFGGGKDYSPFENLTGEMTVHSVESHIDGLDVTPIGYASDSYTVYAVFRLDFPSALPEYDEYQELQLDGYGHTDNKLIDILKSFSEDGHASGSCMGSYIKEDEDTLYYIYTFSCEDKMSGDITFDMSCLNLANSCETLVRDRLIYKDKLFSAKFTVNIRQLEGRRIKNEGSGLDGLNAYVYPCSIVINSTDPETVNEIYRTGLLTPYSAVYITLKNGEKVDVKGSSASYELDNNTSVSFNSASSGLPRYGCMDFRGYLEFPVDPDEIESLTIYGYELKADN